MGVMKLGRNDSPRREKGGAGDLSALRWYRSESDQKRKPIFAYQKPPLKPNGVYWL